MLVLVAIVAYYRDIWCDYSSLALNSSKRRKKGMIVTNKLVTITQEATPQVRWRVAWRLTFYLLLFGGSGVAGGYYRTKGLDLLLDLFTSFIAYPNDHSC